MFSDEHQRCARTVIAQVPGADLPEAHSRVSLPGEADSEVDALFPPRRHADDRRGRTLGIDGDDDLFGGVVPYSFVASKAISHPLVSDDAAAPPEWNRGFSDAIAGVVLPGFTVFSREDAEAGARRTASQRPGAAEVHRRLCRVRPVRTSNDASELAKTLDEQDWDKDRHRTAWFSSRGLNDVSASSIGQVRVGGITASYYALQKETSDENRDNIYVGSALLVVRGGFDDLLSLDFSAGRAHCDSSRRCRFDAAVDRHFPGFFASRRNYDVIRGFDCEDRLVSGVLEQSWRIGGATAAEVLALRAFRSNPDLDHVKCRTVEVFGELADVPDEALLLYRGVDPNAGPLTRYAVSER